MSKDTNNQKIETDFLSVKGNLICWHDAFIQISNITMITTTDMRSVPFPILALLILCVGVYFLEQEVIQIGLLAVCIGGIWIAWWYYKKYKLEQLKNLNFLLNSGDVFTIIFNDKEFLNKVANVLKNILEKEQRNADITFNIKDNIFRDNSSALNDIKNLRR